MLRPLTEELLSGVSLVVFSETSQSELLRLVAVACYSGAVVPAVLMPACGSFSCCGRGGSVSLML